MTTGSEFEEIKSALKEGRCTE